MKALVAGWFSYEGFGATAGDLMAKEVVCAWLQEAERDYDVALASPFEGGVALENARPEAYEDLIFVCGPFGNGPPIPELLERFRHCRFIGVNLSMLQPLQEWNPFEVLFERDSDLTVRPDLTFLAATDKVPLVGVILVHPQGEYGDRALHQYANRAIQDLVGRRHVAAVAIDTRLDEGDNSLRTPQEVESLVARMDAVVTTRLHGTVLALKNGVPALPIDPIRGGAKISKQVTKIGWPILFRADELSEDALEQAFTYCLSPVARTKARQVARDAAGTLRETRTRFIESLRR